MSLNKFMHPRNKYKNKKPDFKQLASEYAEFEKHTTTDSSGKVHLDFKDAKALRALTKTLLKHDFHLDVDLPPDRLVPTIPLRLNYIHWVEDILSKTESSVKGIDIGTGSSCVYPLLGCHLNNWFFLATEMDGQNFHYATKNVKTNHLEDKIKVKKMAKGDILLAAVKDSKECFHFCMCNPPFFADHMEAQAVTTSRNVDRADPFSVSTASPEESISQGGEINFVSQMIDESVELKTRIRVFTSMVGKKSSLPQLKEKLRLTPGATFATTEFCQGKTMRWGIAWTFDDSISFPKSLFHTAKKDKPPLSYTIPFGAATCLYEIADLSQYITSLLCDLQVKYKEGKSDALSCSWFISAKEKSWQNQRRKRRKIQRETTPQKKKETLKPVSVLDVTKDDERININMDAVKEVGGETVECVCPPVSDGDNKHHDTGITNNRKENNNKSKEMLNTVENKKRKCETIDSEHQVKRVHMNTEDSESNKCLNIDSEHQIKREHMNTEDSESNKCVNIDSEHQVKREHMDTEDSESNKCENEITAAIEMKVDNTVANSQSKRGTEKQKGSSYVLKCYINLKKVEKTFVLELVWVDGESREVLHQLMQYFKNKLKAPEV